MAKIDCRDTVNFLRERKRMCDSNLHCCGDCALREASKRTEHMCSSYIYAYPDHAVEIVQKWSDEHPQKTRLDDLLEKYPNVPRSDDGTPNFSPGVLGYCWDCPECRNWNSPGIAECWHEPLDGGATGKAVE